MTLRFPRVLFLSALCCWTAAAFGSQQPPPCSYEEFPDYNDQPTLRWQAPVGTTLSGQTKFDFDGDGQPELMTVRARIERDRAVNTVTRQRSDSLFCWFHVRLEVRDKSSRLLYRDEWSIKFHDMPELAATHGASGPEDYFSRFWQPQRNGEHWRRHSAVTRSADRLRSS
jgi:hypothetical protein